MARWLLCQTVVEHSPRDVLVAGLLHSGLASHWQTWLPHTAETTLDSRAWAFSRTDAPQLFAKLQALIESRRHALGSGRDGSQVPALVAFIDGRVGVDPRMYTAILEQGPAVGVYSLWLGDDPRMVPGAATK
ncbi:MAG: hypothetical protein WKF82_10040 [Nocardioidaceae bacterium]